MVAERGQRHKNINIFNVTIKIIYTWRGLSASWQNPGWYWTMDDLGALTAEKVPCDQPLKNRRVEKRHPTAGQIKRIQIGKTSPGPQPEVKDLDQN